MSFCIRTYSVKAFQRNGLISENTLKIHFLKKLYKLHHSKCLVVQFRDSDTILHEKMTSKV